MSNRPDYVNCLKNSRRSWCDKTSSMEWMFQSIEHVTGNRANGGRLVCCPECLRKAGRPDLAAIEEGLIE